MFFGVKILLKLALGELMNAEMLRFSADLKSERGRRRVGSSFFLKEDSSFMFLA